MTNAIAIRNRTPVFNEERYYKKKTEPKAVTRYESTKRESHESTTESAAYYILANRIDQEFGAHERITLEDIYYRVTYRMGLTLNETKDAVKRAISHGYLTKRSLKPTYSNF